MDRYNKENMSNFATGTNKRLKTEERTSCGPACCTRSKTRMSVAATDQENVAGPSRTSCYQSSSRAKYQSGLQNPGLKRVREPLVNLGERRARITTALSEVGEGSTRAIKKESVAFHEQKKLYSILEASKQKKETKEHEYVKFSNENITDSNKYRRIVRYSGAAQNSSIYNNSSPFKELACKAQQIIIIHDGLPSLMKKTLKRQIIRSSGIRGIIDLDPNKNTVHPSILYSSYLTDIIKILLIKETKYALLAGFMKKSSLHLHTRKTLVNWLLKVQQYFKSDSSVFFTTVRLFDRLLNMTSIPLDHVQLVGVVAYWIASKFNDIITLKVNDIEKICRYKFTTLQLMSTEHKVLRFLKFDINLEEPMIFVRYYIYKMQLPDCDELSFCANYILDCLAMDSDFSSITLSFQAASAVHLSLIYLDYDTRIWNRLVDQPGFYTPLKMLPLQTRMQSLIQLVQDPNFEFHEPYVKYKSERYGAVSFKLLKKQIGT